MMRSKPTEALLDVNVIIASFFADHVMHGQARSFVEGLEHFHTTPMTPFSKKTILPFTVAARVEMMG